jgi:hypothetical protein
VKARGAHGDWSDSTQAELDGLAQMLAAGQRTAELTQMLSDPYFLQRRLALGSHRHLLHDLDVCDAALEEVIRRERFEQRSSAADAALNRRAYLRLIRQFVVQRGPDLEGPVNARKMLEEMLGGKYSELSLGPASVRLLLVRLSAFVRASNEWLAGIANPRNRPFQVCLPLRHDPAAQVAASRRSRAEAEEGLRGELGRVLVVNAARLQIGIVLLSPEVSEEFEGYFARVTVVPGSEGRGAEPRAIATSLLEQARNAFSDLYMTRSSSVRSSLAWCTRLLEPPPVSSAANAGSLTARSSVSERAYREGEGWLRQARMCSTDLCMEQLSQALHIRKRLHVAQHTGLYACLPARDRAEADLLLTHMSDILRSSHVPHHEGGKQRLAGLRAEEVSELDVLMLRVRGVEHGSSQWHCEPPPSPATTAGGTRPEDMVATEVEKWVSGASESLAAALDLPPQALELVVHSAVPAMPDPVPAPAAAGGGGGRGGQARSGAGAGGSGGGGGGGGSSASLVSLHGRMPQAPAAPSSAGPSDDGAGGHAGTEAVVVRVRVRDGQAAEELMAAPARAVGPLKNWCKMYKVASTEVPSSAFRLWFARPLPLSSQLSDTLSSRTRASINASPDAMLGGSGSMQQLMDHEDLAAAFARALGAELHGVHVVCKVSKSRRSLSLCVSARAQQEVTLYFEHLLFRLQHPTTTDSPRAYHSGEASDLQRDVGTPARRAFPWEGPEEEEADLWEDDDKDGGSAGGADASMDLGKDGEGGGSGVVDDWTQEVASMLHSLLVAVEKRESRFAPWHPLRALKPAGMDGRTAATARHDGEEGWGNSEAEEEGEEADAVADEMADVAMRMSTREWWVANHLKELVLQLEILESRQASYCPLHSRDAVVKHMLAELPNSRHTSRAQPKVLLLQAPKGSGTSSVLAQLWRKVDVARAAGGGNRVASAADGGEGEEREGVDEIILVGACKRPGMSLLCLCQYIVEELWFQLRGCDTLPDYYAVPSDQDEEQDPKPPNQAGMPCHGNQDEQQDRAQAPHATDATDAPAQQQQQQQQQKRAEDCVGEAQGAEDVVASVLKWRNAGASKPDKGRELEHAKLAQALARKTEFTQREWEALGITQQLAPGDYIKAGDNYYKPADAGMKGDVTVLHGGTSVLSMTPCREGVTIWADGEGYTIRVLPRILDGCNLVQLPCRLEQRINIVLRSAATVYVFFPSPEPGENKGGAEPASENEQDGNCAGAEPDTGAGTGRGWMQDAEVYSDGGLCDKLLADGWESHTISDDVFQTSEGTQGQMPQRFTAVLSKTFHRAATYALPAADGVAVMGLAVKLHEVVLLVEYDAMGRLVVPDGTSRLVPMPLVSVPESLAGGPELLDDAADGDRMVDSLEEDGVGAPGGGAEDEWGSGDADAGKHLVLVVDQLSQGELQPLLEAVGLMETPLEIADNRRRRQAAMAAAAVQRILRQERINFLPGSAVLTQGSRGILQRVAQSGLARCEPMVIKLHGHTACPPSTRCGEAATCKHRALAGQRCEAVMEELKQHLHDGSDRHQFVVTAHGCKHPRVGAKMLVRIQPEPMASKVAAAAGGVSERTRAAAVTSIKAGVRMRQLRTASKELLSIPGLRVTVVCSSDYFLDEDMCSQDENLEIPLQDISVVNLGSLTFKEARKLAMASADASNVRVAQGNSMSMSLSNALKGFEKQVLEREFARDNGAQVSPLYIGAAVATLQATHSSFVNFPITTAGLTDWVLARLEQRYDKRLVTTIVSEMLDHPEGINWGDLDLLAHANASAPALRHASGAASASSSGAARPSETTAASTRSKMYQEIAQALGPLLFSPHLRARAELEQQLPSTSDDPSASALPARASSGAGGGVGGARGGPQWWESNVLARKLVPQNLDVRRYPCPKP